MTEFERVRVTQSSRNRLRELKQSESDTYSNVLDELLPADTEGGQIESDDTVSISVSPEIHDRVSELSGDGVPAYRVIEYYLYLNEMKQVMAADELLDLLFNRGNDTEREDEI